MTNLHFHSFERNVQCFCHMQFATFDLTLRLVVCCTLNLTFSRALSLSLSLFPSLSRVQIWNFISNCIRQFCTRRKSRLLFSWTNTIAKGLAKFFVLLKLIILKYWWYDGCMCVSVSVRVCMQTQCEMSLQNIKKVCIQNDTKLKGPFGYIYIMYILNVVEHASLWSTGFHF